MYIYTECCHIFFLKDSMDCEMNALDICQNVGLPPSLPPHYCLLCVYVCRLENSVRPMRTTTSVAHFTYVPACTLDVWGSFNGGGGGREQDGGPYL